MTGSSSSAAKQLIQNLVKIATSKASAWRISQTTVIQIWFADSQYYAIDGDDWYPNGTVTDSDIASSIDNGWVAALLDKNPILESIVHQSDIERRWIFDGTVEERKVVLGSCTGSGFGCAVTVRNKRTIVNNTRIK